MFNNKNKKTSSHTVSNSNNNIPSVNMISEGTKVTGALHTKNDIRVAGKVDGEATSEGKLILTSTGHIEGDINAVDADIAGKVDGELRISNKLIMRKSALVTGDIYTKVILVEEGAQIDGSFKMSSTPPSKSSKAAEAAQKKAIRSKDGVAKNAEATKNAEAIKDAEKAG